MESEIVRLLQRAAIDVINRVSPSTNQRPFLLDTSSLVNDTHEDSKTMVRSKRGLSSYGLSPVPDMRISEENFAHEYVSSTGVGNREEVQIKMVSELKIVLRTPSADNRALRYIRFNSSNFIMSRQPYLINIWYFNQVMDGFNFDLHSSACHLDTRHDGLIVAAEFERKVVRHTEFLHLALVLNTPNNGVQLRSFAVSDGKCHPLNVFELRRHSLKLSYVTSHHESAAVILSESQSGTPRVDFSRSAGEYGGRVIEVSVQGAVDLETYTANGHSFVAVASSRGVYIYRFSEFLERAMPFDQINVDRVTDISVFHMQFRLYLGVATSSFQQFLYEWRDGSFHPKQTFQVPGVMEWKQIEIPSCRDDVLITFIRNDRKEPLQLYVWSGVYDAFLPAYENMRHNLSVEFTPQSLASFSVHRLGFLIGIDRMARPRALSFNVQLIPVSDPVFIQLKVGVGNMKKMKDTFVKQEDFVGAMTSDLKFALRPYGIVHLPPQSRLRHVTSRRTAVLGTLNPGSRVELQGFASPLDFTIQPTVMRQALWRLSSSLTGIRVQMRHMAFRNQPTFMSGHNLVHGIAAHQISSSSFHLVRANGIDVNQVLNNMFLIHMRPVINGKKSFSNLRVSGMASGVVNSVPIGKAVLINGHHKILTPMNIRVMNVAENLNLVAVNGLVLNNIFLLDGPEVVMNSPAHFFWPMMTVDSMLTQRISGIQVDSLTQNVLLVTSDQRVLSPLVFKNGLHVKNVFANSLTNGANLVQLEADILRRNRPSRIFSPKIFSGLVDIRTQLKLNGTLAGVRLPADLFYSSSFQVVTGRKRMVSQTRFASTVTVKQRVDGIKIPSDIVTLAGLDTIPNVAFGKGLDLFTSLNVSGRVDEVDLLQLAIRSVKGKDGKLVNPVINGPVMVTGTLEVSGLINGLKLKSLYQDIVFRGESPVHVTGLKTLRQPLFSPELKIETINGLKLEQLATTKYPESISRLILKHVVFNKTQVKNAQINDINLINLYLSRISLSNPGYIVGNKHFFKELRVDREFSVMGALTGIFPSRDFVLKRSNQHVTGRKRFTASLRFDGALTVNGRLNSGGFVDGVNLTLLNVIRMTLSSQQVTRLTTAITGSRTGSLVSPNINHLNMRGYIPNIMLRYGHQVVTAPKTFTFPVRVFGDIQTKRGVNQVRLDVLKEEAFRLKSPNLISIPFYLLDVAQIESTGLTLYGLLNGIDLNYLAADSVMKRIGAVLHGRNHFHNGFTTTSDINVNRVNGLIIPNAILLKAGHQLIHGPFMFRKTVRMTKNMDVAGTVNGIKISSVDKSIMKTNRPNMVRTRLWFITHVHVAGDLRSGGRIDNVLIKELTQNSLLKLFDQKVTAHKVIMAPSLVSAQNLLIMNVNGHSLDHLIQDMIFINRRSNVEVLAPKIFSRGLKTNRNLVIRNALVSMTGRVNNVFLTELWESAVPLNKGSLLFGTKTFGDTIRINYGMAKVLGRVNGVHMLHDTLKLRGINGLQPVHGRKVFAKVLSAENLVVKGMINGVSISALYRDTLYKSGNQLMTGRKMVRGIITSQRSVMAKRLNSMQDFKSELITLSGDQSLQGVIKFLNPLNIMNDAFIRGSVSGRNFSNIVSNSLYRDAHQLIPGRLTFDRLVFNRNVDIAGLVSGIDLGLLSNDVQNFRHTLDMNAKLIRSVMTNQLQKSSRSYDLSSSNPIRIAGFKRVQELPNVRGKYFGSDLRGSLFLRDIEKLGRIVVTYTLNYRPDLKRFTAIRVDPRSAFIEKKYFEMGGLTFAILRPAVESDSKTLITSGSSRVASLDSFVDDVQVVVTDSSTCIVFLLIGIKGQVKVYSLHQSQGSKFKLVTLAVLNVGYGKSIVFQQFSDTDCFIRSISLGLICHEERSIPRSFPELQECLPCQ